MAEPLAYFDTSVLVKRYLDEQGSTRARSLIRNHRVVSSVVAPLEAVSALSRRQAAGLLSEAGFAASRARLLSDRNHWELVDVDERVIERAGELIPSTRLRTLDALHLASAMYFQWRSGNRVPFVTSDALLRDAAKRLSLRIIWVGP